MSVRGIRQLPGAVWRWRPRRRHLVGATATVAVAVALIISSGVSVFALRHASYIGAALLGLMWGFRGGLMGGAAAAILAPAAGWLVGLPPDSLSDALTHLVLLLAVGGGVGVARAALATVTAGAASRSRYERALGACSRVLLVERQERALDLALGYLLEATNATEIYVDSNYQHLELGLCARTMHEMVRPGAESFLGSESWTDFAYTEIPTCYGQLVKGEPSQIMTSRLSGRERDFYEQAGVRSELALPIVVGGEWLGVVGFADHEQPRVWSTSEVRFLTTVAEMIGAFWIRQRDEVALRESENRFRQLVEASPEPIAVHAEGRIVYANTAAAKLLGAVHAMALMGRPVVDFVHPDSREVVADRMRTLIEERRPVEPLEERFVRLDGAVIDVEVSAMPVEYQGQAAAQVVVRDITAQKVARLQLEELVRQKDEFLASISHELRTPLTAVLGLAQQLSEQGDSIFGEETRELIDIIVDQSNELSHIIEDLLVEARADLGTLAIRPGMIDLSREVTLACAGFNGVKLVPEEGLVVVADPVRVRQILRNLLSNAVRYGGDKVIVAVTADPPLAKVAVQDDGPGIPENEWERIFEPYYRAHAQETQPASIGLGLTVSRRLARLMGGDLTYECRDGTSFFEFSLPLQSAPQDAAPARGEHRHP